MERYFISDTHFGHTNIITHLGDVTMDRGGKGQQLKFKAFMERLNGHKRLHLGNHDHFPIKVYAEVFEKVYATWRDDGGILFSHIPVHPTALGSAKANIHGHIHANKSPKPAERIGKYGKTEYVPYVNISVEVTDYRPLHYDEILTRVKEQAHG